MDAIFIFNEAVLVHSFGCHVFTFFSILFKLAFFASQASRINLHIPEGDEGEEDGEAESERSDGQNQEGARTNRNHWSHPRQTERTGFWRISSRCILDASMAL